MPKKRVLKPPQREIMTNGHGGAREGAGRPAKDLQPHAVSLARFCRAHGWTVKAICEGLEIDDETLNRQVDLDVRGAHGEMQALIWREMFNCAMSNNPDKVHPAVKAKMLLFFGERLFSPQILAPQGEDPKVIEGKGVDLEEVAAKLLKTASSPEEQKVIIDVVERLMGESESGGTP